jgi:cytochrome c oxidase cbb3-type subunit 1
MNEATSPEELRTRPEHAIVARSSVFVSAAWHSVAWLAAANLVGVLLAVLLLFPQGNAWLAPWTYGRWMPVHINLQLYGWSSLPLVAFLLKVYQVDRAPAAEWCRTVLWMWSAALTVGSLSWLTGHSSGKLFLEWTGFARVVFPLAMGFLWLLLAWSLRSHWHEAGNASRLLKLVKVAGLVCLWVVPFLIYWSAGANVYPPVNPDTGGPTGASQLESTLAIVAMLLVLPFGISRRTAESRRWLFVAAAVFFAEALLCLVIGRGSVSHHRPAQYLGLASVLIWVGVVPAYYREFAWAPLSKRWKLTWLCWWSVLVPGGWILFLPGVLDHFKYTDALVGHALMAMAGFVTSFLIFLLVVLLGDDSEIFASTWAWALWQGSTLGYIALMLVAGWIEGNNPAFHMDPGAGRNTIYALRLLLGSLMTLASIHWFLRASSVRWPSPATLTPPIARSPRTMESV